LSEGSTATRPVVAPVPDRIAAVSPTLLKPLEPAPASVPAVAPGARIESAAPASAVTSAAGTSAAPAQDPLRAPDTPQSDPHPKKLASTDVAGSSAASPPSIASGTHRTAASKAKTAAPTPRPGTRPPPPTEASKPRAGKGREDPDIDLVAAIIARLDRRGSDPDGPARPSAASPSHAGPAGIDARLQKCSAGRDPAEARQCRGKACDGHRGKVDACPASRIPKTSRRGGMADVESD
jgi:hypothetical protein